MKIQITLEKEDWRTFQKYIEKEIQKTLNTKKCKK